MIATAAGGDDVELKGRLLGLSVSGTMGGGETWMTVAGVANLFKVEVIMAVCRLSNLHSEGPAMGENETNRAV